MFPARSTLFFVRWEGTKAVYGGATSYAVVSYAVGRMARGTAKTHRPFAEWVRRHGNNFTVDIYYGFPSRIKALRFKGGALATYRRSRIRGDRPR